ncbi:MAG TPA: hypothetical protein VI139_00325, partial [Gemmatimonadales bacterium]
GKSPIGGGHELAKFRAAVAAVPLQQIEDVDVTDGIAPTFDVLDRAYKQALEPAYRLFLARMTAQHPWILRVVRWTFRKTFDKIEHKHFSGRRNGASFKQYKSYRLLLFRKR